MTAINASPKVATPFKPRLLWRGSLLLADGTALPGIAFVSSVPPSFTSKSDPNSITSSGSKQINEDVIPPLTLNREQQDALSLSIEMVRHAPINISEVIEDVEKDTTGNLLKPKRFISSGNVKENGDNIHVSYQAAGGVRMYVDPAYPSSVAYLERIFCYEADEDDENLEKSDVTGDEIRSSHIDFNPMQRTGEQDSLYQKISSSSVIVLSLERSYRYSLAPRDTGEVDDVFSHDSITGVHTLQASNRNEATMEAVIIGMRGVDDKGAPKMELHIGQKVVRKMSKMEGKGCEEKMSMSASRPRPDDPAPRGLSRMLSAKYSSMQSKSSRQSSLPTSTSPQFLSPALPTRDNSIKKRPSLSNLGTNDDRSSSMPMLKRSTSESLQQEASHSKRSKSMQMTTMTTATTSNKDIDDLQKIEEKNRSLIKKMVHHQLLGKGIEKKDEEYLKCFNPTCNGTVLALRKQFKIEIIDRAQAASIIEKHLDMYL